MSAETTASERVDADLALRAMYGEYFHVHPSIRDRCRWVMDTKTWQALIDQRTSEGVPLAFPVPGRLSVWMLLGLPVEVRTSAEGIRLELAP